MKDFVTALAVAIGLAICLGGCASASAELALTPSDEPFVENPRFCVMPPGSGNACRIVPFPAALRVEA